MRLLSTRALAAAVAMSCANLSQDAQAQEKKPNILVIMGDDIGWFNPSCCNSGMMGYRTPNIDRIAAEGARFEVWTKEFTKLRVPTLYNLRADPFERGPESMEYERWKFDHVFLLVPAQAMAAQWLSTFKEFPPRQKPASFNLDEVMRKMTEAPGAK